MSMIGYRCKNCRWFDQEHESLVKVSENYGYCRKHKPVIYRLENQYYGGWPLVDMEDFCGEFREDREVS